MEKTCEEITTLLQDHGIRPTAVRILILRCIEKLHHTFSLADIEAHLLTVDKSTVFRTLTLFAEHHLLHTSDDGSGSKKYCLCRHSESCTPSARHSHFHCTICKKTYCLDEVIVPQINTPAGFIVSEMEYTMHGTCPACNKKSHTSH